MSPRWLGPPMLGVVLVLTMPALATAHPLGNFTINHYADVRVEPDRVLLDVVIDQAEIPTFQARQAFDLDGDGTLSDEEIDVGRVVACGDLAPSLKVSVDDGPALDVVTIEAGLSFPPGVGGLSTMRLTCAFEARLATPIGDGPARISFVDGSYAARLGWREITARGSGVTLDALEGALRDASVSDRLLTYPEDQIATPFADQRLVVEATLGGTSLPAFDVPDADPIAGVAASPDPTTLPGAVPGGVGSGELPSIFREADLTPVVLLVSLLTATGLGAGHALTPGHGKTLMAAYLIGTRGTAWHALGLGLSVSLSHTVGILVLAALVVGASDALPPDTVVRWAPVVAAVSIVAIGAWMLTIELRRRRFAPADRVDQGEHSHSADHAHRPDDHGHDHAHGHADRGADHADHASRDEHSHGGMPHTHLPPVGSAITWKSLFVLGLAGGLIPSTSALLILLGAIAAGRSTFGFVLVVAFGLGMAVVMGGIGITLVVARQHLDRLPMGAGLARVRAAVPLVAAVLVFSFGIYLTAQAIAGARTL